MAAGASGPFNGIRLESASADFIGKHFPDSHFQGSYQSILKKTPQHQNKPCEKGRRTCMDCKGGRRRIRGKRGEKWNRHLFLQDVEFPVFV
jgi:hypothetical protein